MVQKRTEQLQKAYDKFLQSKKALKESNKQLKRYASRITQIQEDERKRVAYKLHDDTAQYLGILKMQINALVQSGKIQNPDVLEKLRYLENDADRAFNEVRRYSHDLRPIVLEYQGLVAALEQIVDDYNKLGQLAVELQVEGEEPELPEKIKLGLFRIVQEALNNTSKHSKADQANIDIRFDHNQVWMTVADNGTRFVSKQVCNMTTSKISSDLMMIIRGRADLINANLKTESEPGKGTRIIIKTKV